jgi:D-arabinose 1-dehydrogenase-like Zn-dependent alcohol dehydrogenase
MVAPVLSLYVSVVSSSSVAPMRTLARELKPSFFRMLRTWLSTVCSEMNRARADLLVAQAFAHRVLALNATFVAVGASANTVYGGARTLRHLASVRLAPVGGSRRVVLFIAKLNKADLQVLRELLEAGKVTPVLDRRYALHEVPEALRYLGQGHAQGKIVINPGRADHS